MLTTLIAGMWGVVGACRRGRIEVGKDGMLHLSALAAMPNDREPARTRDAIYRSIGNVQFPDVILEVDAATIAFRQFPDMLVSCGCSRCRRSQNSASSMSIKGLAPARALRIKDAVSGSSLAK